MRAVKTNTEVRRAQIARAALARIAQLGFHRLSVAAVAKEVGVAPSGIYRHFPGKDALLDAVLELIAQRLRRHVATARRQSRTALARLRTLLLSHARTVQRDVPIPRVVFAEEIFTGHKRRRQRVRQIFEPYLGQIAAMIVEGQRAGEIRRDLAAETLAVMFLGLAQPPAILWLISEGAFDFTKQVQNAWRIFRRMIQAESPSPEPNPRGRRGPAKPRGERQRPPLVTILTTHARNPDKLWKQTANPSPSPCQPPFWT
jgi:AcrR family transcriptional regulator